MNNEITAPEIRVIGADGENIGVLPREKALELVKHGEGIDLIEISPNAKPPVARLMSFDKYRYMQGKAEKKARLAQKTAELKQIQISVRAAKNDLLIKAKQMDKFLGEGHNIDVMMRLRGAEKYNKPRAFAKLDEFMKMITVEHKRLGEPKFGGRGMILPVAPVIKK
ncbi:MAG TPA: translation initiation factor IF-3 [Candidatus Paceibacterota bacterium]|nr:translation initiation factor IF-3 [Candidatus Paceibacterota bacterium]